MASRASSLSTSDAGTETTVSGRMFVGAALVIAAVLVDLVFAKSINWDEFFHFSQIHAKLRGENVQWLQTPHVFLFSWVPSLPGTPIDHIQLIRLILLPFAIGTSLAVFDIARRFTDRQSAAFAALAFAGGGNVLLHAFALRADIIAAGLTMFALWILATRPRSVLWVLAATTLAALSLVATIKSVLLWPALLAMAGWRWQDRINVRTATIATVSACVIAAFAFVLLPDSITNPVIGLAKSSYNRMFSAGLFPQGDYFLSQLVLAPVLTAFVVLAISGLSRGDKRMPWWLALGLIAPLLSVAIYRNAYPYFYPFILGPVAIVAALGVQQASKVLRPQMLLVAVMVNVAVLSITEPRDTIGIQRQIHAGITQVFPKPVRYIDDIAFRPDYPRAVPRFASGWALENYHRKNQPAYKNAMESAATPMLFVQGYALETRYPQANDKQALLPEDAATLRGNYVQHWGRLFVAGKVIAPSETAQPISIITPGAYTVENGPIVIADREYAAGAYVDLKQGEVSMRVIGDQTVTLRWGRDLARPSAQFPDGYIFTDY